MTKKNGNIPFLVSCQSFIPNPSTLKTLRVHINNLSAPDFKNALSLKKKKKKLKEWSVENNFRALII